VDHTTGIIARLSAAVVSATGTVLRALQTGRVQAYSAGMVLGLAGVGWFLVRPHATGGDDRRSQPPRERRGLVLSAAPGPGYSYRWDGPGVTGEQGFHAPARSSSSSSSLGDKKDVVLEVRNDGSTTSTRRPSR